MAEYTVVDYKSLLAFTREVFLRMGMNDSEASLAATNLTHADLRAVDSHGVARLDGYTRLCEVGRINPNPNIKIVREKTSTAAIDGDRGIGLIVGAKAMQIAIDKAKETGTGWVAVKNSNHFGIAANYAMMALENNMIGIAMTNASALVAPIFSKEKMLGTNPIAFAAPAKSYPPFIADFSTTTAANGKLEILQREEQNTPDGWVQDDSGENSNDAHVLKKGGSLLPLGSTRINGGHKGYALGSMVDILCGVLSGASFGPFVPPFPAYIPMPSFMPGSGLGHFFGAFSIDAFNDADLFLENMDLWIKTFKSAEPVSREQKVLIPGEPEYEAHKERLEYGIPLIHSIYNNLLSIKEKYSITTSI